MRIAVALVCAAAVTTAALFLASSEQSSTARRRALRDFDVRAREAIDALADLRAAQQAYVAIGQGADYWLPRADELSRTVGDKLGQLQAAATSPAAANALDKAVADFAELGNVDRRVRGYLSSGAPLMAADIVYTEGGAGAASAARAVEEARQEEHAAFDRFEASRRRQEAMAAGGAAAFALLSVVLLAFRRPTARPAAGGAADLDRPAPSTRLIAPPAAADDLPLQEPARLRGPVAAAPPSEPAAEPSAGPAAPSLLVEPRADGPSLAATAALCTEIGRAAGLDDLRPLIARAADLLEASGLVLWIASPSGTELRPAIAHGYAPRVAARLPTVPRSADNAAAAALRSGSIQIVPGRAGTSATSALAAPIPSAEGVAGVLTAELRSGLESAESRQSLLLIIAAQLGGPLGQLASHAAGRTADSAAV